MKQGMFDVSTVLLGDCDFVCIQKDLYVEVYVR